MVSRNDGAQLCAGSLYTYNTRSPWRRGMPSRTESDRREESEVALNSNKRNLDGNIFFSKVPEDDRRVTAARRAGTLRAFKSPLEDRRRGADGFPILFHYRYCYYRNALVVITENLFGRN